MKKNIILIGFMGAGKTDVAMGLSKRLGIPVIDTDSMIEKEQGMSISEIFAKKGEPYFRDLETALLKSLSNAEGNVISTGGGMVLRDENVKALKSLGPLVLLSARPEVVMLRLLGKTDRPLLSGKDRQKKIEKLLLERRPIYEKAADLAVDTSDISVDDAVEKIANFLKGRCL